MSEADSLTPAAPGRAPSQRQNQKLRRKLGALDAAWRLCTAHFVLHFLSLGLAAAAPLVLPAPDSRSRRLVYSEGYLLLGSLLLALYKVAGQRVPAEAAVESLLCQGQAVVLVVLWPLRSAVCLWWALVFALLHLLVPISEPTILLPGTGEGTSPLQELTQRQLDAISDPSSGASGSADSSHAAQLVVLYSHISSQSHQHAPMLAGLAQRYSGPALKWGRLDVARFPEVGERFGVRGAALASPGIFFSLPVLLLFSRGVLRARLDPHSASPWRMVLRSSSRLSEAQVVKQFELDSWLVLNRNKDK